MSLKDQGVHRIVSELTLDRDMTVKDSEYHERLYSMSKAERQERIEELVSPVELEGKKDTHQTPERRDERRLEIARGLMTQPKVLFPDEPNRVDPDQIRIWDYLRISIIRAQLF